LVRVVRSKQKVLIQYFLQLLQQAAVAHPMAQVDLVDLAAVEHAIQHLAAQVILQAHHHHKATMVAQQVEVQDLVAVVVVEHLQLVPLVAALLAALVAQALMHTQLGQVLLALESVVTTQAVVVVLVIQQRHPHQADQAVAEMVATTMAAVPILHQLLELQTQAAVAVVPLMDQVHLIHPTEAVQVL
jgi:hypothetical protein